MLLQARSLGCHISFVMVLLDVLLNHSVDGSAVRINNERKRALALFPSVKHAVAGLNRFLCQR